MSTDPSRLTFWTPGLRSLATFAILSGPETQRPASLAEARGRSAGTALAEWPSSRARAELCAQRGAARPLIGEWDSL